MNREISEQSSAREDLPFLFRLCPDEAFGQSAPLEKAPIEEGLSYALATRRETAALLPFILRLWWIRELVGSERFVCWSHSMFTAPVGSQYSDPICDAGASDFPY
ncbi:MAG: hypothetical protein KC652_20040 [Cyanobacteria bacterium HKST-UBA01]|nr:hypothetical protein [Cyanobacteria bacterium HKST-UBA01]